MQHVCRNAARRAGSSATADTCFNLAEILTRKDTHRSCTRREFIQLIKKRALRTIYGDQIKRMPYFNILFLANLESLKDRREKIANPSLSCLHSLLPPERNTELLCKLRNPTKYPIPIPELKDTSLS